MMPGENRHTGEVYSPPPQTPSRTGPSRSFCHPVKRVGSRVWMCDQIIQAAERRHRCVFLIFSWGSKGNGCIPGNCSNSVDLGPYVDDPHITSLIIFVCARAKTTSQQPRCCSPVANVDPFDYCNFGCQIVTHGLPHKGQG